MADPQIGPSPGIDDVEAALSDRPAQVRDQIIEMLVGSNQPSGELIKIAICASEPKIRASAVVAVARLIRPADVVPRLIEICHDPDGENRGRAGWALGKLGSDATDGLATLIKLAETDETMDARYGGMWALARLGPAALETEERVRRCLTGNRDESFRAVAAAALGAMGAASEESRRALIEATQDDDGLVREEAVAALGRLGTGPDTTDALINALSDAAPLVRETAAIAIGRVSTGTAPEVAALIAALDDPGPYVRRKASDALQLLGQSQPSQHPPGDSAELPPKTTEDSAAIEHWMARLDSDSPFGRAEAAWELGIPGPPSAPALAALRRQALGDPNSDARWAACLAIGRIRLCDTDNVETLSRAAIDDWDPDVRSAAVEALGGLGFSSSNVLGPLADALQDEDSLVREKVCSALEQIGWVTPGVLRALHRAVDDRHPSVRARAVAAITAIRRLASR